MKARSMTGYARARRALGEGEITVSVKSLNHRALDVHVHMPPELEPLENLVRAAVKQRVRRGHVQVQVRLNGAARALSVALNQRLLDAYLDAYRQAALAHCLVGEPDLNLALQVPGMFEAAEAEPQPETEQALRAALEAALEALDGFRRREGAEIAAVVAASNQAIQSHVARMEEIRARALPAFQARLQERLTQLLGNVPLEPQRLAQEAAILVDRSDISEELTRLRVHAAEVAALFETDGEVGKKLDFLLQEMQREANTVLAKASGAGDPGLAITDLALAVRVEIERIREQAGNLE
jgi:uncharacterized protein (TIGR00255 family)